jgi:hypothetical protein
LPDACALTGLPGNEPVDALRQLTLDRVIDLHRHHVRTAKCSVELWDAPN